MSSTSAAPSRNRRQNKVVMFSELKRNTRFIHPETGEETYCTYNDGECIGTGPSMGYTTCYVKASDPLWQKPVDLNLL